MKSRIKRLFERFDRVENEDTGTLTPINPGDVKKDITSKMPGIEKAKNKLKKYAS